MAHQALHIKCCGDALPTKPNKYISSRIHVSPNVTYTKVCGHTAHQTLPIYMFSSRSLFYILYMFCRFSQNSWFSLFSGFLCFPCFPCFPLTAFPGAVAGSRLTAFPEVRFMRCAVHGSNLNTMRAPAQLSEKPSYQRWTRLQPMQETPIKS